MRYSKRDRIRKATSSKAVDYKGAMAAANDQDFQKKLEAGFPQLMLRVSRGGLNGLRFGQPPPIVN